ncbi:MAG: bacteriohemerythrin [Desulfobulbaceae bacterium]
MALIEWSENLSVNVAEIDKQHQKLIALINELADSMRQGQGRKVVGKIISGLQAYTEIHFKAEENYFRQFGYPDAARHIQEHEAFVAKVTEFNNGFERGALSLSVDLLNFLSDWLRHHIKGEDKKYSSFFNAKGLQ